MSAMAPFFHAMAPTLTANILTVAFVYCFAKVVQCERRGEEGYGSYLWLIVMILLFTLYGLYTWKHAPRWKAEPVAVSHSLCCSEAPREEMRKIRRRRETETIAP